MLIARLQGALLEAQHLLERGRFGLSYPECVRLKREIDEAIVASVGFGLIAEDDFPWPDSRAHQIATLEEELENVAVYAGTVEAERAKTERLAREAAAKGFDVGPALRGYLQELDEARDHFSVEPDDWEVKR